MPGLTRVVAPLLAIVCGVFTAYTTFQPELAQLEEERHGNFKKTHVETKGQEHAISSAIINDLKEAREEATQRVNAGGFAWGIRKAIYGYDPYKAPGRVETSVLEKDAPKPNDESTTSK